MKVWLIVSAIKHVQFATMKNQKSRVKMSEHTEQVIIAVTGTATKISGTATAASGTIGFWAFLIDHQQPILILCAIIGAVITMITAAINARFQRKRDEREHERHLIEIAIDTYKLDQLKAESEKRRRKEDT